MTTNNYILEAKTQLMRKISVNCFAEVNYSFSRNLYIVEFLQHSEQSVGNSQLSILQRSSNRIKLAVSTSLFADDLF